MLLESDEVVISDVTSNPQLITWSPDGIYTGRSWSADFGGSWSADMAFDGTCIWQVNVGGDNAIHKIDPMNGRTVGSISNPAWTSTGQRGWHTT